MHQRKFGLDNRRIAPRWAKLLNKRMAEGLSNDETLSVLEEGVSIGDGWYKLRRFVEDMDYCDPETEGWIWSIGKHRITGEIIASTTACFYMNKDWECLFLR